MRATFDLTGLDDLEADLAAIPKALSEGVIFRAISSELQLVADAANALWPGAEDQAFAVSRKVKGARVARGGPVVVYVGSTKYAPQAHLLEWGTEPRSHKSGKYVGQVAPSPMLTPSWDAQKDDLLQRIVAQLRVEFEATVQRRTKAFVKRA